MNIRRETGPAGPMRHMYIRLIYAAGTGERWMTTVPVVFYKKPFDRKGREKDEMANF